MRAGEDLPALAALYRLPGVPGEPSLHPPAAAEWGKPTFHQELPPLRETWYGRASAGKGVVNELLRSAGQRPTGHQLGLRVCLLPCRVRVGVCTCRSASVGFCHFQDILAGGKLIFFPPQPVLESISVTRSQAPYPHQSSPWEQPHSPASTWHAATPACIRASARTAALKLPVTHPFCSPAATGHIDIISLIRIRFWVMCSAGKT